MVPPPAPLLQLAKNLPSTVPRSAVEGVVEWFSTLETTQQNMRVCDAVHSLFSVLHGMYFNGGGDARAALFQPHTLPRHRSYFFAHVVSLDAHAWFSSAALVDMDAGGADVDAWNTDSVLVATPAAGVPQVHVTSYGGGRMNTRVTEAAVFAPGGAAQLAPPADEGAEDDAVFRACERAMQDYVQSTKLPQIHARMAREAQKAGRPDSAGRVGAFSNRYIGRGAVVTVLEYKPLEKRRSAVVMRTYLVHAGNSIAWTCIDETAGRGTDATTHQLYTLDRAAPVERALAKEAFLYLPVLSQAPCAAQSLFVLRNEAGPPGLSGGWAHTTVLAVRLEVARLCAALAAEPPFATADAVRRFLRPHAMPDRAAFAMFDGDMFCIGDCAAVLGDTDAARNTSINILAVQDVVHYIRVVLDIAVVRCADGAWARVPELAALGRRVCVTAELLAGAANDGTTACAAFVLREAPGTRISVDCSRARIVVKAEHSSNGKLQSAEYTFALHSILATCQKYAGCVHPAGVINRLCAVNGKHTNMRCEEGRVHILAPVELVAHAETEAVGADATSVFSHVQCQNTALDLLCVHKDLSSELHSIALDHARTALCEGKSRGAVKATGSLFYSFSIDAENNLDTGSFTET